MKRIAIRNKTEGRIVLNGMKGIVLVGYSQNKPLYIEVDDKGLSDKELIGLQQANLIEVTEVNVKPEAKVELKIDAKSNSDKPAKGGKKGKQSKVVSPKDANDTMGNEVTVGTESGPKKGNMKPRIVGDAVVPLKNNGDGPELLDLNKY